jgi:hypothetical protein
MSSNINPLNAKLNPICHLLALLGAHRILHISRIRVKDDNCQLILKKIMRVGGNQHSVPLGKLYIMLAKSELKFMGYI